MTQSRLLENEVWVKPVFATPLTPPRGRTEQKLNRGINMDELDKTMYFGAKPDILEKARALRKNMTEAEKILWERLKNKQILNLRFRRQHPIDIFIADFYCHTVRLVIELDGNIHKMQKEYDEGRTAEMEQFEIKVIRFKNEEIENNIESVIEKIESTIIQRLKSPPWGI